MNQDEQKKKEERELRELRRKYVETFGSASGKDVLRNLVSECHIFHTTFTGNSKGMFMEGQRNIGLYLLDMLYGTDDHQSLEKLKAMEDLQAFDEPQGYDDIDADKLYQ